MTRPILSIIGMVAVFTSLLLASNNNPGCAQVAELYDYTICITTQHLDRQFKFRGSQMEDKIDRLDADVYDKDNEQNAAPYKSLWSSQGRPLGLEMFNQFAVAKGHAVCMKIKHKNANPTDGEMKAAANAILRLWVDSRLNQSAVIVVKVPGDSFYSIIDDLRNQGMDVAAEVQNGEDINEPMTLLIESDAAGQKHQRLAYR